MIDNKSWRWISSSLSVAVAGIVLTGCGGSGEDTTQNTTGSGSTPATTRKQTTTRETPAQLAALFPGAQLTMRPVLMDANGAKHMSEMAGVKFTGDEGTWEFYEAVQDGRRIGMAVQTHSTLPEGKDMHVGFAVDNTLKITKAVAIETPNQDKMTAFLAQFAGKKYNAAYKIGKDLKAPDGMPVQTAQTAADAVHKGMVILEEYFNPSHGENEDHKAADKVTGGATNSTDAGKATTGHEGHAHGPNDGHGH